MRLFSLFLLLALAPVCEASVLGLETVTQPLYLHGSDSDARIALTAVPFATYTPDPEWRFSSIGIPYIPPTDGSWKAHDVNLASLYRVKTSSEFKRDGKDIVVTIDATTAAVPEGYPFTLEQVIDAVVTCVKINYPQRPPDEGAMEIVIKRSSDKSGARK